MTSVRVMGAGTSQRESRRKNYSGKQEQKAEQAARKRRKMWSKQRLQNTREALDRDLGVLYDSAMVEQPTPPLQETTENQVSSVTEKIRRLGASC